MDINADKETTKPRLNWAEALSQGGREWNTFIGEPEDRFEGVSK